MQKLIQQNYDSTIKRGLIKDETVHLDFLEKIYEEYAELNEEIYEFLDIDMSAKTHKLTKNAALECTDIILTCMNYLVHSGYDPEQLMNEKININYERSMSILRKE